VIPRRVITLHSFRRFVKTLVEKYSSESYSEWFLGHTKSSYWVSKKEELRRIYKVQCMKYLTFLDYPTLENTGRDIENKLNAVVEQKDKQIAELKLKIQEMTIRTDKLDALQEQIDAINKKLGVDIPSDLSADIDRYKHLNRVLDAQKETIKKVKKSPKYRKEVAEMDDLFSRWRADKTNRQLIAQIDAKIDELHNRK